MIIITITITTANSPPDASRFLAQSQSRINFAPDPPNNHQNGPSRQKRYNNNTNQPTGSTARSPFSRSSYMQRAIGNPYQPASSHISHFPFASRTSTHHAPLFHSATDEFREEDDEQEHEREVEDFYALQRSRRHFGASHLEESSEIEEDDANGNGSSAHNDETPSASHRLGRVPGIKSSWRGKGKANNPHLALNGEPISENEEADDQESNSDDDSNGSGKDRMVDVGLEDTLKTDMVDVQRDEEPPPDFDESPPPVQFRYQPHAASGDDFQASGSSFFPQETDRQALLNNKDPRPSSPSSNASAPASVTYPDPEPPHHDAFWGNLFLISLAALLATSFLVYLHTTAPTKLPVLGDTIYSTLHASFFLLATYTLVAIIVSLLWLALLRSYVRLLVYAMLIAVPVILYSFSLYPFISSFKGPWHGSTIQDKVMRWASLVPAIIATVWLYSAAKGRHSMGKAINILEFSCRILSANPALLFLGFAVQALIATWTWLWILMFTRVFLNGHTSTAKKNLFIIDVGSWWLGAYFVLVYLWSLGVIAGIQRTTTAATVSQWYFHRLAVPAPSSRQIVQAALHHSVTTLFGTICLSTCIALLIRLPLIILPRRLASLVSMAAYSLVPTPIAALTNPLALTYGAVHSLPLTVSARALGQFSFLIPSNAATAIHPRYFSAYDRNESSRSLVAYRLSKLILHAMRFVMSLALSFGSWVSTSRSLKLANNSADSSTARGSLYAYVVGLIAGAIGWGVLGAMEGVLAGVVDAAVVCWASEVGTSRKEATYCREAGWLFGQGGDERSNQHGLNNV
ncbi:hypothetical protein AJ80_05043 [Polytolypa hystricis UAMH7299]|uniref:Ctl transporter n=1 Tax=Polytolypa hystricis (strain UAMH7299) TaxID=1447883 RepID=A0A2B7Y732_POLH7|nr:hypothetical protein AJ80_05043 [Polytolypa hystricis UAMH7299]